MRRLQILMDEELDDALEREARRRRRSKSALLREIVRAKLLPLPPLEKDALWGMTAADDYESEPIDEIVYGKPHGRRQV